MQHFDILIIGSGMGGLVCGNILCLEGYSVCVLEKNKQIGGSLQTYVRDKVIFDSGVHYIGGLDRGQNLYQVFRYLGLMDKLKLQKMGENAFDKIVIGDDAREYSLAQGYPNFIAQLAKDFPGEESALQKYGDMLRLVCSKFPLYNLRTGGEYKEKEEVLEINAQAFIASLTENKTLRAVLAGNNILYAGMGSKTPLYIHALIMNSYIESSWKCVDGGSQIAKLMAQHIRKNGSTVRTRACVQKIVEENGKITHVELDGGENISAGQFISNAHPVKTLEMLDTDLIRGAYRKRLENLENSISCFSLNIVLKKGCFPYFSNNYYWHREGHIWNLTDYTQDNWPLGYAIFLSPSSKPTKYADALTIMTYMKYEEVKEWEHTFNTVLLQRERGKDYESFKQQKTERLLDTVSIKFPGIRNCIQSMYAATPLSYRDYTGTGDGSLYGIIKDFADPVKTLISPRTKLPNFYLTGQNLNLHGILGATLTALATCTAILGNEDVIEKIKNA